jgi:ATP-dependent Clp protease ATP-binding subunit ClpA
LFSRFSPASKRVLRAAEQECRNHSHYYVGVEHVLLALLDERDDAIEAKLAGQGIKPSDLRAELKRRLGTGDDRLWEGILVTPRVRKIVLMAEARVGPDGLVEPLHLLEAICNEGRSAAAEALAPPRNVRRSRRVAG